MRKRGIGIPLCALFFALCSFVSAQQPPKLPRIGFLSAQSESRSADRAEAFRQGLRDLGYAPGKNILIEYRWADGNNDRLPGLADELVQLHVDVIVTSGGTLAVVAAKNATKSIPIVISSGGNVVEAGLVNSFSRPGGNVTGVTIGGYELSGKRLEVLKDVIPKLSRAAYIFNPTALVGELSTKEINRSAQALGVRVQLLEVRRSDEVAEAFGAAIKGRAEALIAAQNPPISSDYKSFVDLTLKHRLPAIYADNSWSAVGGLMSYGASITDQHRRMAKYVDKILKGAKVGELPIEQPTKFEFVINLKAAKQIGLTIPPNVLARADRVIR